MIYCLNPNCERPENPNDRQNCQGCGELLKGYLRNRYKVLEAIGTGGFGKTYLATDRDKLNELCVVKQLVFCHQGTQTNKKIKQLFEQEAKQLQLLGEHPQIPMLLAYFEEDDYLYLVQQFIKGENLQQKLDREGIFSEIKVKELLMDLLPILEFIHSKGVIHRDIKLSNIMYSSDREQYVLIDFGVSKIITSSLTQTGTSLGSQGYAAPEQFLKGKAIPASDFYGLGATCFHLLSGISPFELWIERGYSWSEAWQDLIKIPISPELASILDKLLQYEIPQRYRRAEKVLQDLQNSCGRSIYSKAERTSADPNLSVKSEDGFRNKKFWLQLAAFIVAGVAVNILGLALFKFGFDSQITSDRQELPKKINARSIEKTIQDRGGENFNQIENVPSGLFNYGGSTTWASIRKEADPAIQIVWPNFQLRYTSPISGNPGSGTGIKMLLEDQLSFSQSSRPLKDKEYQKAKLRGYTLEEIPVAIDAIAIAAHPSLSVSGLTVTQLKDIYTGKISNWQEVGGPDLPVVAYSRHPKEGGTVEFFADNVLGDEKFGENVVLVPDTTAGIRKVAKNPGGIYYASAIQVIPQCSVKAMSIGRSTDNFVSPYQEPTIPPSQCGSQRNKLNRSAFRNGDYPITRRLFVILKNDGQQDEKAGRAYVELLLTVQGQKLINKAGFVSINLQGN